jgi:hypothetical protein
MSTGIIINIWKNVVDRQLHIVVGIDLVTNAVSASNPLMPSRANEKMDHS